MEPVTELVLDEASQVLLRDLIRGSNELSARIQIAIQMFLNANKVDGIWDLSQDGTRLVKRPEQVKAQ